MILTPYHAKYFANDLTRRSTSGLDRLSMSLFDASVDLNPHQIEAALFALESRQASCCVSFGRSVSAG
jgi:hypothetical protein